jgi:hypothetical protein
LPLASSSAYRDFFPSQTEGRKGTVRIPGRDKRENSRLNGLVAVFSGPI